MKLIMCGFRRIDNSVLLDAFHLFALDQCEWPLRLILIEEIQTKASIQPRVHNLAETRHWIRISSGVWLDFEDQLDAEICLRNLKFNGLLIV